jgi:hypothetical protein
MAQQWKLTYWPGSANLEPGWHNDPEKVKELETVHTFFDDREKEEIELDEDGPTWKLTEDSDGCLLEKV